MKLMKELVKVALFTPTRRGWGLTLGFEGDPGVGKSDVIEGMCGEWNMPCEVLSPGERGEGAFGVVPVPVDGLLTYPPPEYIKKFQDAGSRGLVFVDELTCFPAGTPVTTLRVDGSTEARPIEDLRVGDTVLSVDLETGRCRSNLVSHLVSRRAALVELELTDGRTIRCTPDHQILTATGWKPAAELCEDDVIRHVPAVCEAVR